MFANLYLYSEKIIEGNNIEKLSMLFSCQTLHPYITLHILNMNIMNDNHIALILSYSPPHLKSTLEGVLVDAGEDRVRGVEAAEHKHEPWRHPLQIQARNNPPC